MKEKCFQQKHPEKFAILLVQHDSVVLPATLLLWGFVYLFLFNQVIPLSPRFSFKGRPGRDCSFKSTLTLTETSISVHRSAGFAFCFFFLFYQGESLKCCCLHLYSASGATDHGGDLLHDEEVQIEANDPDPGEAVQVWVHHCGHLPRRCHSQWARGQMASVWLPHLLPL